MDDLTASFFIQNRFKLKRILPPSAAVVISSARPVLRNGDQYYPYRQSSDMYYLTGIHQAGCTLVIAAGSGEDRFSEALFIPGPDEKTTRWEGAQLSPGEAQVISGIKDIQLNKNLGRFAGEMLKACDYVYYGTKDGIFPSNELEVKKATAALSGHLKELDLVPLLTRLRMIKEPEELGMISDAIRISGEAFDRVLRTIRPGMREYAVEALLSYELRMNGVREHAFDPIVASGKNALTLHYTESKGVCNDGDLLLMDFGAVRNYYAADISRTIPVNGTYSKRQRELYDAVLRVLQQAIQRMRPGKLLREYHREVGLLWQEEHLRLGIYSMKELNDHRGIDPLWKEYYWHGTSHSIGLDVHDRFNQDAVLAPGMVLSCEPGIYIPEEGIGIRIENDLLLTDNGVVDLTREIPLEAEAIEAIMHAS